MRWVVFIALTFSLCNIPTLPTDNPNEIHILSETSRFAEIMRVKVTAEVTDEVYMTLSSNGTEMVPAAGWYSDGHIKYWRVVVRSQDTWYGTRLAAHEVCHAKSMGHDKLLDACVNGLLNGNP